jgi:hypothetical protein
LASSLNLIIATVTILFENVKPGGLGFGVGILFGGNLGIHPADFLPHRATAEGTLLECLTFDGTPELESLRADAATSIPIVRIFRLIFVNRHGRKPEKSAGQKTAPFLNLTVETNLPRGLCHSGKQAM